MCTEPGLLRSMGKTVLIVDDNLVNLKLAQSLIRVCGYETDTASKGNDAVRMVKSKRYAVVFMDHLMPEMDGIETVKAIRDAGYSADTLPIIALSSSATEENRGIYISAGMQDILDKPIDKTKLNYLLDKWAKGTKSIHPDEMNLSHEQQRVSGKKSIIPAFIEPFSEIKRPDRRKKVIVFVDDSPSNIQIIMSSLKEYYKIIPFVSGGEAVKYFESGHTCDMILLDIEMPGMDGFETFAKIKAQEITESIPVMFLTGNIDFASEIKGLNMGAVDYIYKPINPPLVKKRIDMHIEIIEYNTNLERLVEGKTKTVEKLANVTIYAMISIIGAKDHETQGHINRTSEYVVALGKALVKNGLYVDELTDDKLYLLRKSAPLHDVGKVGIADEILTKTGKLTPEEYEKMKKHTIIGGEAFNVAIELMSEPSFLDIAKMLALNHHEKWDGTGYPNGISGTDIPLYARIMAVADVYDALISKRAYKSSIPHEQAVNVIMEGRGTHFDPDICDAFFSASEAFNKIAAHFADEKF